MARISSWWRSPLWRTSPGYIPGAINAPLAKLRGIANERFKKDEKIVAYRASYHCHASTKAAKLLLNLGYRNVLDFKAGKDGWTKAGLDLEN